MRIISIPCQGLTPNAFLLMTVVKMKKTLEEVDSIKGIYPCPFLIIPSYYHPIVSYSHHPITLSLYHLI